MFDIPENDWELDDEIHKIISDIYIKVSSNGAYAPFDDEVLHFLTVKLENIRYVILGQDPYPSYCDGIPEATGRSFEVRSLKLWNNTSKCTSIWTILKAIYHSYSGEKLYHINDVRIRIKEGHFPIMNPKEWFDNLEHQGVLWLNCSLTRGINNCSHLNLWKDFLDIIVYYLERKKVVWIAMGEKAINYLEKRVDEARIIFSAHPRCSRRFLEDNPFLRIQDINWCGL